MQKKAASKLRASYSERHLARLNSCSGKVAGKWLSAFPSSWWPEFADDHFIMALRFRAGISVVRPGHVCQHHSARDADLECNQIMDVHGDHCIICGIGGHLFMRHDAVNHILAEAARASGYTALMEQTIPELVSVKSLADGSVRVTEARLDIELCGHAYAPDHLIDATVRHASTGKSTHAAARVAGHAAEMGVKAKAKRYPSCHGRVVLGCAIETGGYTSKTLDALLEELAGLAARRQRQRGVLPTRWLVKWRTQLSMAVARCIRRAIVESLPKVDRYWRFAGVAEHFSRADVFDEAPG